MNLMSSGVLQLELADEAPPPPPIAVTGAAVAAGGPEPVRLPAATIGASSIPQNLPQSLALTPSCDQGAPQVIAGLEAGAVLHERVAGPAADCLGPGNPIVLASMSVGDALSGQASHEVVPGPPFQAVPTFVTVPGVDSNVVPGPLGPIARPGHAGSGAKQLGVTQGSNVRDISLAGAGLSGLAPGMTSSALSAMVEASSALVAMVEDE
jgi:hypothetical protein